MKVEKKQNPSILATYWNLSKKSGDLKRKFFKIWRMSVIFSIKNYLYRSKFYFVPNLPVKETLLPTLLPESHSTEHPRTDFHLIDATVSTRLSERKNGLKLTTLLWEKKGGIFAKFWN